MKDSSRNTAHTQQWQRGERLALHWKTWRWEIICTQQSLDHYLYDASIGFLIHYQSTNSIIWPLLSLDHWSEALLKPAKRGSASARLFFDCRTRAVPLMSYNPVPQPMHHVMKMINHATLVLLGPWAKFGVLVRPAYHSSVLAWHGKQSVEHTSCAVRAPC